MVCCKLLQQGRVKGTGLHMSTYFLNVEIVCPPRVEQALELRASFLGRQSLINLSCLLICGCVARMSAIRGGSQIYRSPLMPRAKIFKSAPIDPFLDYNLGCLISYLNLHFFASSSRIFSTSPHSPPTLTLLRHCATKTFMIIMH